MQIKESINYDQFKRIGGNRLINKNHVKRLAESIAHNPDTIKTDPILINSKSEIIDGQHRFEACKLLGLPIYYVQGNGLDLADVQRLNSASKTWTLIDFARSYAERGNKHYETYLDFLAKYKLGLTVTMIYLSLDKAVTPQYFKDGKLKVTDEKKSAELCRSLRDIGDALANTKHKTLFNTKPFSNAFKRAFSSPNYDHKRMIDKMIKYGEDELERTESIEDTMRGLERVFNKRVPAKDKKLLFK